MSAEPAHDGPGGTTPANTPGGTTTPAAVLLFRKRAQPGRHPHGQDSLPPGSGRPATPHHRLANRVEQSFLKHGRTLTDPETAEDYRIAIEVFANILEGARVHGIIDDGAHGELHAMIDGMRAAPDLVENV